MIFRSLKLRDYRNYRDLEIKFAPRLNILLGENGQGKTNLLESLFLLSQGDSFRFGDHSVLLRDGAEAALVRSRVEDRSLDYDIEAKILKSRKNFLLNEKKVQASELRKKLPVVLFSPESLNAIKEGADWRRELVDDALVLHQPIHANLISEYRKALRTRNRILKDLSEMEPDRRAAQIDLLESLNPTFFRLATELTIARLRAIDALEEDFRHSFRRISSVESVDISVDYVVSSQKARSWTAAEVSDAIRKRAQELRSAEVSSGTSLVGPHKHEITFLYHQKDSRIYCSQGQQRALILSFKMAQIVYHGRVHGTHPVLLLDDVLSELDSSKQKALIAFLQEIQTQVFLTTTDLTLSKNFVMENSAVIRVQNGRLESDVQ